MSATSRLCAAALGLCAGLVLSVPMLEVAARTLGSASLGGTRLAHPESHPLHPRQGLYMLDGEEGYRPAPSNPDYGPHGALHNVYALARDGSTPRVLCIGDSVTRRGRIVDALRKRAPSVEWWNGGVEGWATRQQAAYVERIGPGIAPDLVLLLLHLNDFEVTPVNFVDDNGEFVQFRPSAPRKLSAGLYRRSALYRRWIAWTDRSGDERALAAELLGALARMQNEARGRGFELAVAVLPLFAAPGVLPESVETLAQQRTEVVLAWLDQNGVPGFDLRPAIIAAATAGVALDQTPGDAQHPSWPAGDACAAHLIARGLLDLLPARD